MNDPTEYRDDQHVSVKVTSLSVLGLGLAALFLGYERFWLVFVLGFAVLVPIVATLSEELDGGEGDRRNRADSTARRSGESDRRDDGSAHRSAERVGHDAESESKQDALDALRERYARGDLTEAEFERKVETLLETETPESARKHVERTRSRDEGTRTRDADETGTHRETDERRN
jgi:hypothetical protein